MTDARLRWLTTERRHLLLHEELVTRIKAREEESGGKTFPTRKIGYGNPPEAKKGFAAELADIKRNRQLSRIDSRVVLKHFSRERRSHASEDRVLHRYSHSVCRLLLGGRTVVLESGLVLDSPASRCDDGAT